MLNSKYIGKLKRLNNIASIIAQSAVTGLLVQQQTPLNVMEYTAINNTVKRLKSC